MAHLWAWEWTSSHKSQIEQNKNIMAIETAFYFINNTAYHIESTMAYVSNIYESNNVMYHGTYDSIMAILSTMKFNREYRFQLIPDCLTGIVRPTDLWMQEYGIEYMYSGWIGADQLDQDSIVTFPCDIQSDHDDEECIESEDEEELCVGQHIIMELVREDAEERGLFDEAANNGREYTQ